MDVNAFSKTVSSVINQRLLDMHTAFIGKIISINLNILTVQPLSMYKVYGETAQISSVLTGVHVLMPYKYVYRVDEETEELIEIVQRELEAGDSIFCVVCERDITAAKDGKISSSITGRHHSLSDSIAVMGLSVIEYVKGEDEE